MNESRAPRLSIIVAVAAVSGIIVTLLAQYIMSNGSTDVADATGKGESQRIEALEAQLKALQQSVRPGK